MADMNPSCVVIGAGISGLTAAYQLKKAGLDVLVLEARDHVGGRMVTVEWEGFRFDPGAKFVTTSDRFLLDLASEVGLDGQMYKMEEGLTITIYRDGQLHTANFLSIGSYLRWSGVSLRARLAMLKLIPHFLRMRLDNPYHLERAPGDDVDETYEAFFKERINEEMFEYWAVPMFETMCSYKGEDVSRKAFLAMLASYLNADSMGFRDGIGILPQTLAAHVPVELGAQVQRIRTASNGSGVSIDYLQGGAPRNVDAGRVIVAVPGNYVLPLFDEPRPAWQSFFPNVNYSSTAMQFHIAETDFQPGVIGAFVPRASGKPINAIGFEEWKDGRWLILTDPSVYIFELQDSDEVLVERATQVMEEVFPALKGTLLAHRIFRWPEKVPTLRPGYLDALVDFWADPQEGPAYFCGDYFAGPSTGGALYSGKEAAERLLAGM
jgi:oxygen-dependent protoporphyrinogen oxidase